MLRSIATVSISGTLPEKLHAIAAAGYQGVEIFENDLLYYTGTPAEIRQLAADLGLKITLFQPFRDFEGASRAQFAANMARARRKFALMHELGCETLLLCSNVQPDCSADSELQVADLRALATLAEEEGIAIGYEALAWGTHVNRWQQAWERVRRVDSPALGLVLDSFHILARGDTLDALPSVPVEKITFVQLADAPYMKMDLLEWSRHFRCFPGQGELPLEAFAEQITRCGYRDLPAACDQLAEVARHTLPIPANYYDDLLARFGGELDVGQLQRQQLLYDRDPQGGDFLHLYTRPFTAGRFFFELTERRAGYALYGAANAAVRMAAMQYC
ncbi:TPA: sugar phosphate isomerase/epimerase and 4-hydroxyphenylpyruvate domain-containing protein [Klebsiella pneumoniae]|nr:sugar phosphate isomerase/epimerase and 4-hydroxyphenylpyruvate domain-containing protein [Klebsiella pneumoniae]